MPKRILIVDDDPNIQDTAKDILEDAGYAVETAGTGAAAMQKLGSKNTQLAFFDFNLPDITGVDLALSAKAAHPTLTIVLLTGEASVDLGPAKAAVQSV